MKEKKEYYSNEIKKKIEICFNNETKISNIHKRIRN